jgi:rhodanese-related sulfurtransferase
MIVLFAVLIVREGRRMSELEAKVAVSPAELYALLARSKTPPQIVDLREGYEDSHIPGAIPFPACNQASEWIIESRPSVIVSEEGDPALFAKCRERFTLARNLAGGMTAWIEESYPEDEGEFLPPRTSAGGGCL